jgi:predicted metalloprotease
MTPARLRDVEALGLFPGKYFGVFLRTYAAAVQYATGVTGLFDKANAAPDAPEDLSARLYQQATCLAGVASGAMAGQGAVDDNITKEIRARLTSTDDPPAAAAWLTKGFDSRQPARCNTWA